MRKHNRTTGSADSLAAATRTRDFVKKIMSWFVKLFQRNAMLCMRFLVSFRWSLGQALINLATYRLSASEKETIAYVFMPSPKCIRSNTNILNTNQMRFSILQIKHWACVQSIVVLANRCYLWRNWFRVNLCDTRNAFQRTHRSGCPFRGGEKREPHANCTSLPSATN